MKSNASVSGSGSGNAVAHHAARTIVAWAPGVAYVAAVGAVVIYMFIYGPAIRAEAESRNVEEIDQENTLFCQKFGMPRGTDAFATCVSYLADIRKRDEKRVSRDLDPVF
jgi:hypothetical protein